MCGFIAGPFRGDSFYTDGIEGMNYRGRQPATSRSTSNFEIHHVRLPIQTPVGGHGAQPFTLPDGGAMAFCGEIFDPRIQEGKTTEEDLLNAIGQYPTARASRLCQLDGFWSLVTVPSFNSRYMYVFTDHLGIKPVYYDGDSGVVCSEIVPLIRPGHPLDEIYLANCVKFGYDYSGRTAFEGISQMPPGSMLRIDASGMEPPELTVYWNWDLVPSCRSEDFPQLLTDAVKARVLGYHNGGYNMSGLLLSGGLDSSIIYQILVNEDILDEVHVFHTENGESEFLPAGVEILDTGEEVGLGHAVLSMQAPMDLGSLIPQTLLAEACECLHLDVVLTGDGADEVFGGYRRAKEYDSQASDVFCELPYYHLPRLDRIHMRQTQEVRSPYLAPAVVKYGLELPYEERTEKQALKAAATILGVDPLIVNRPKHPLKSRQVLEGGIQHRVDLKEVFEYVYG